MDMTKDALSYVVALGNAQQLEINGRPYTDKTLHGVTEPLVSPVCVTTLSGLMGLVEAGVGGFDPTDSVLHVVHETRIELKRVDVDKWGSRDLFAVAEFKPPNPFPFGRYIDPEEFVIFLLSGFAASDDLTKLARLCSNLSAEKVHTALDDGISQTASVRKGVVIKEEQRIAPRVMLAPFRSFPEVEQVASNFLFRLKGSGEDVPDCALFEADGGMWRVYQVAAVQTWLQKALANGSERVKLLPVVA
jgi:hypothetical protein